MYGVDGPVHPIDLTHWLALAKLGLAAREHFFELCDGKVDVRGAHGFIVDCSE